MESKLLFIIISYAILFFPLLTLILCAIFFYYYRHNYFYEYFPTISQMNVFPPERYIFSVNLSITAILIFIFGYICYKFIKTLKSNSNLTVYKIIYIISLIISSISMILFSCFPVRYYQAIHSISAALFFCLTFLFYLIYDIILKKCNKDYPIIQFLITFSSLFFIVLYFIFKTVGLNKENDILCSISSVWEIASIIMLLVKVIFIFNYKKKVSVDTENK